MCLSNVCKSLYMFYLFISLYDEFVEKQILMNLSVLSDCKLRKKICIYYYRYWIECYLSTMRIPPLSALATIDA